MTRRTCGCYLERLGWRSHLHTIRKSSKRLTAGGMTVLDADAVRILEDLLPGALWRRGGRLPSSSKTRPRRVSPGSVWSCIRE